MACSTITPAFFLCLLLLLKHRAVSLIESSSKASSSLSVFCGIMSCKLPHSHCPCPAVCWPLRSFYLSCWSLSVGRFPYISIQSLFSPVFITAVKTFHPSLLIFESLFCRAQDYFLDLTAVSHRAWQGEWKKESWTLKITLFPRLSHENIHQYQIKTCIYYFCRAVVIIIATSLILLCVHAMATLCNDLIALAWRPLWIWNIVVCSCANRVQALVAVWYRQTNHFLLRLLKKHICIEISNSFF